MKHKALVATVLLAALSGFAKTFDVDISTGRPAASNEAYYHGETIEFRAVRGRSVVTNVEYSCVYYQTNGMGDVWWKTDGLTFHPTNDVGAASYRFFMEGRDDLGRDWHANGLLRLLPSPGFTPNEITMPVATLDFSGIEVLNAPWTDPDYSTNNAALVETIEATAPAPGNYAAVSNAAVHAAITNALQDAAISTLSTANARQDSEIVAAHVQIATFIDGLAVKADRDDLLDYVPLGGDSTITGDITINGEVSIRGDGGLGVEGGLSVYSGVAALYDGIEIGPDQRIYVDQANGDIIFEGFGEDGPYRSKLRPDGSDVMTSNRVASATNGLLRGEYAALTNNAAFTSAVAAVSPPTDISGKQDNLPYPTNAIPYAAISGKPSLATVATSGSYNDLSNKPTIPTVPTNVSAFNNDAGYLTGYTESDPTIKSWAKANTKPTYTASEVGAATAEDVYRIVAGTNVILVVTNYNSAVHAPSMKLQHLDPESGQYVTYWDEQRRHGMTLTNAMDYTDAAAAAELSRADAAYAPRAWSGTTSALGAEAPAGVTWISTPETVIAGGYEYEKVITTAGAVWVLTSNGLSTGATTNSYFRVAASDGTELFSIEKTDSYLVGVNATGITKSGNTVTIPVNVVAPSHPYIRATTNLVNAVWTKEDENGFTCPFASVSWSGSSGAYVATVTCSQPQAFFYFEFMQQGTAKIKNSAKTEMTGGIIFNGTTYMPTVSGNELKFIATQL